MIITNKNFKYEQAPQQVNLINNRLPLELLQQSFNYLTGTAWQAIALTNRSWHKLVKPLILTAAHAQLSQLVELIIISSEQKEKVTIPAPLLANLKEIQVKILDSKENILFVDKPVTAPMTDQSCPKIQIDPLSINQLRSTVLIALSLIEPAQLEYLRDHTYPTYYSVLFKNLLGLTLTYKKIIPIQEKLCPLDASNSLLSTSENLLQLEVLTIIEQLIAYHDTNQALELSSQFDKLSDFMRSKIVTNLLKINETSRALNVTFLIRKEELKSLAFYEIAQLLKKQGKLDQAIALLPFIGEENDQLRKDLCIALKKANRLSSALELVYHINDLHMRQITLKKLERITSE